MLYDSCLPVFGIIHLYEYIKQGGKNEKKIISLVLVLLAGGLLTLKSCHKVPAGYVGVIYSPSGTGESVDSGI